MQKNKNILPHKGGGTFFGLIVLVAVAILAIIFFGVFRIFEILANPREWQWRFFKK